MNLGNAVREIISKMTGRQSNIASNGYTHTQDIKNENDKGMDQIGHMMEKSV